LQRSSVFQESEACNASSDRGQISRLWLNTLRLLESCAKEFRFIIDASGSRPLDYFKRLFFMSSTPVPAKGCGQPGLAAVALRPAFPHLLSLVPRMHERPLLFLRGFAFFLQFRALCPAGRNGDYQFDLAWSN
jgi:hypothetical protein